MSYYLVISMASLLSQSVRVFFLIILEHSYTLPSHSSYSTILGAYSLFSTRLHSFNKIYIMNNMGKLGPNHFSTAALLFSPVWSYRPYAHARRPVLFPPVTENLIILGREQKVREYSRRIPTVCIRKGRAMRICFR